MPEQVKKKDKGGNIIICTIDENGVEQGPFEKHFTKGPIGKGTYKDGKIEGPLIAHWSSGQLFLACTYRNGKIDGPAIQYHENGQLWVKCTFKDGKREGSYEEYYENGQLKVRKSYKDGRVSGPYKIYHENGVIKKKGDYLLVDCNGRLVVREAGVCEEYYDNGQLKERQHYKDGVLDGLCERYYENGVLIEKQNYRNGHLYGPYEQYADNGQLTFRCYVGEKGKNEGPIERYDRTGELIEKEVWHNGKKLEGKEAEDYLKEWEEKQKREAEEKHAEEVQFAQRLGEAIGNIKGRMQIISDPAFQKPVGTARTPERQSKLERYVIARRKRDILYQIFQQAMAGEDEALLAKMRKTIDENKLKELGKKGKEKLSPTNKKFLEKLMEAARPFISHQYDVQMEFRRTRAARKRKAER